MALLGDVAGLTGCIAGVAYKNISRNLRIKRNLDASAYLHGMDRPQATDEEMDIVRAKIAWDIKNRKGEICPLEMLDFFENGAVNKKEAISYWSGCMFEQIFEDAGLNTRKPIYITRGKNYMLDFQTRYAQQLHYWRQSKHTEINVKDIPSYCPVCGYKVTDPALDCPVCGRKAFIQGVKPYTEIMKEVDEMLNAGYRKIEENNKKVNEAFKKGWIVSAVILFFISIIIAVVVPYMDSILFGLLFLSVIISFVFGYIYMRIYESWLKKKDD